MSKDEHKQNKTTHINTYTENPPPLPSTLPPIGQQVKMLSYQSSNSNSSAGCVSQSTLKGQPPKSTVRTSISSVTTAATAAVTTTNWQATQHQRYTVQAPLNSNNNNNSNSFIQNEQRSTAAG